MEDHPLQDGFILQGCQHLQEEDADGDENVPERMQEHRSEKVAGSQVEVAQHHTDERQRQHVSRSATATPKRGTSGRRPGVRFAKHQKTIGDERVKAQITPTEAMTERDGKTRAYRAHRHECNQCPPHSASSVLHC